MRGASPASDAALHLGNAGTASRYLAAACCRGGGAYPHDAVPRMRGTPSSG